jgi:hypothetical protein
MKETPEDEYRIKPILKRFDIEDEQLYEALVEQFDRVCGDYMRVTKDVKNSINLSISCVLKVCLDFDEDGKKPLRKSIKDLADQLESYSRKGC